MSDAPPMGEVVDGLDVDRPPYTGKQCNYEQCENPIPANNEPGFKPARTKCDVHYGKRPSRAKGGAPKTRRDGAPIDLNVNLGGPKGKTAEDKQASKVSAGACQMAQTLGTVISFGGDTECGAAIIAGAPAWGEAIGNLSRYQPWLATIFAPTGEVTGQGLAWIAAIAATAGIVIPVLAHHNLVSPKLANKFAGGMIVAGGMAAQADGEVPDDAAA